MGRAVPEASTFWRALASMLSELSMPTKATDGSTASSSARSVVAVEQPMS